MQLQTQTVIINTGSTKRQRKQVSIPPKIIPVPQMGVPIRMNNPVQPPIFINNNVKWQGTTDTPPRDGYTVAINSIVYEPDSNDPTDVNFFDTLASSGGRSANVNGNVRNDEVLRGKHDVYTINFSVYNSGNNFNYDPKVIIQENVYLPSVDINLLAKYKCKVEFNLNFEFHSFEQFYFAAHAAFHLFSRARMSLVLFLIS